MDWLYERSFARTEWWSESQSLSSSSSTKSESMWNVPRKHSHLSRMLFCFNIAKKSHFSQPRGYACLLDYEKEWNRFLLAFCAFMKQQVTAEKKKIVNSKKSGPLLAMLRILLQMIPHVCWIVSMYRLSQFHGHLGIHGKNLLHSDDSDFFVWAHWTLNSCTILFPSKSTHEIRHMAAFLSFRDFREMIPIISHFSHPSRDGQYPLPFHLMLISPP